MKTKRWIADSLLLMLIPTLSLADWTGDWKGAAVWYQMDWYQAGEQLTQRYHSPCVSISFTLSITGDQLQLRIRDAKSSSSDVRGLCETYELFGTFKASVKNGEIWKDERKIGQITASEVSFSFGQVLRSTVSRPLKRFSLSKRPRDEEKVSDPLSQVEFEFATEKSQNTYRAVVTE